MLGCGVLSACAPGSGEPVPGSLWDPNGSSNWVAHLGIRRTLRRPSSDHVLRPRMHVTTTKAVRVSLLPEADRREAFAVASRFRDDLFDCLTVRGDELFELTDALLCADGPVTAPVDLTLVAEQRRGHGAMYDALNRGNVGAGLTADIAPGGDLRL